MSAVPFLGAAAAARWMGAVGVEPIIVDVAAAIEADLRRWPEFSIPPRLATHVPEGVIELMPAADRDLYGFKFVNGHPSNPARGLQTVAAFGVLADTTTGYPTFVAEMTLLTAVRTAATSALAARLLAPPQARTLAMIGAGSQAEFQALGMRGALGVDRVRIWDRDPAAVAKLAGRLTPLGWEVHAAVDTADAVRGADVITTCTAARRRAAVLTDDLVRPGVHVNAIGGDCPGKTELDPAILRRARIVVELEAQTRVEGEIQALPSDWPVTELWRIVTGQAPGRTDPAAVTVFDSVGCALEDVAVLRYVRDAVVGSDLVIDLDLLAAPDDPKDLFALTIAPA